MISLQRQGQDRSAGFFIAGLNPYRQLDTEYAGFIELIAGQIAAGLANARAYEQERRRAEALAELDREKTIFFSNVSHEFRTPLTLMLGPLEDVLSKREQTIPPEELIQIETVHRNGLRLLKLVNTLLDFSRIEAGRIQALYRPVDLSARTAELASVFRSAMERAGLTYRIDCEPLPEPVFVDLDMWEKIVLNLLSNAFKFTLEGAVELTLRAVDGQAEVAVRDTGTGIPEAELPRIFERFHRIEGAAGRTHEGTGIGLALVDELVRLHGGTVEVGSRPGTGTTFVIRIPFGSGHLPAERLAGEGQFSENKLGAAPYVQEALRWLPGRGFGRRGAVEGPGERRPGRAARPESVRQTRPGAAGRRQPRYARIRAATAGAEIQRDGGRGWGGGVTRHLEIHQCNVGPMLAVRGNRAGSVSSLCNKFDIGLAVHRRDNARTHERVIVDTEDPNRGN
jgi:signal transduction histidine kinase